MFQSSTKKLPKKNKTLRPNLSLTKLQKSYKKSYFKA